MSTPKELADEVRCPFCADAPVMREQMACGSCGEVVVTMSQYGRNFAALTQRPAPPSAGDRTHIADLIDTFEQLRKIVGTPEQDADALIAAVRTLAAPPSAQQATGSGQVLTDVQIMGIAFDQRFLDGPDYIISVVRKALAAAARVQPEAECVKCVRCGHDNWIQEGKAPAQVAAPTTGKREQLTPEKIEEIAKGSRATPLGAVWPHAFAADLQRALGITGEQR